MGGCPLQETGHGLRLGLAKLPRLFEARDGQAAACLCLPATIDHHQVATPGPGHVFDQPAHEWLALGVCGCGSVPERRQILGQRADLFPLLRREPLRIRRRLGLLFPFQPIHFRTFLIPVPLQAARYQSVLRVHRMVTAARQICFGLRPLNLPFRLLITLFRTPLQMGESRERDFQLCLADDLITAIPSPGLADLDRQLGMRLAAFVDQDRSLALRADTHPTATPATEHDPLQERRAITYRSLMSSGRSILGIGQVLLIAPELVPGDGPWMSVQHHDGPLLLRDSACASLDPWFFAGPGVPTGVRSPVDVGSGIQRAVPHIQDATMTQWDPFQLTRTHTAPMPGREAPLILGDVAHHGQRRWMLLKEGEHQTDGTRNRFLGIKDHRAHQVRDESARQAEAQFPLFGFRQLATLQALIQPLTFRFGHGPLKAQQEAVLVRTRIGGALLVTDQRVSEGTNLPQEIPITARTGQTRDFQAQDGSHMAQSHFGHQSLKAVAPNRRGAGLTLILVEDLNACLFPSSFVRA